MTNLSSSDLVIMGGGTDPADDLYHQLQFKSKLITICTEICIWYLTSSSIALLLSDSIFTVFCYGFEHLMSRHCCPVTSNLAVAVETTVLVGSIELPVVILHPIKMIGVRDAWSSASSRHAVLTLFMIQNVNHDS